MAGVLVGTAMGERSGGAANGGTVAAASREDLAVEGADATGGSPSKR